MIQEIRQKLVQILSTDTPTPPPPYRLWRGA